MTLQRCMSLIPPEASLGLGTDDACVRFPANPYSTPPPHEHSFIHSLAAAIILYYGLNMQQRVACQDCVGCQGEEFDTDDGLMPPFLEAISQLPSGTKLAKHKLRSSRFIRRRSKQLEKQHQRDHQSLTTQQEGLPDVAIVLLNLHICG